jgi:hypothetical protein
MKQALWAVGAFVAVLAMEGQPAQAVDQEAVDKAINRGVTFLKNPDAQNLAGAGVLSNKEKLVGVSALVGLTLLECGVAPDDKAVQHAIDEVRPGSVSLHETYSLALAIFFLDRLGDPADAPLIESMTVRLLAGQTRAGGWTYTCPDLAEAEVRRLTSHLKQQSELVGRREAPPEADPDAKPGKRTVKDLPKEIQDQLARINAIRASGPMFVDAGDNSNTQFATVALWVARRHGLPVDKALAQIDLRYRNSQNADGGWAYTPTPLGMNLPGIGDSSAAMTCAGLLGLIAAHGAVADNALANGKPVPELSADKVFKKGLATLGAAIGNPIGKRGVGDAPPTVQTVGGKSYYFFWSLERVAVILGLDTLDGKDWYTWGAEILLGNQMDNGSWAGEYPATVDTCFALLFLKRANLAADLTGHIKGKLQDEVTLKSGGVGGDVLKAQGLKSGLESKDKPHDEPTVSTKPKGPGESRLASEETEGGRMARELVRASPERRDELLDKYRDGKGVTYTEALAGAIPQMAGEDKRKAREALAGRLTRMKAETLGRYFQDDAAEIRRAAALAAAMKESKSLIPDLIPLLSDAEPDVARAAHAALKDLSGENLGPSAEEWKAWWKKQEGK